MKTDFKKLNKKPREDGIQYIANFENGYGASIIKTQTSYGGKNGLWEVAVLDADGDICYTTGITDNVLGHLSEEVNETLDKIKAL